MEAAEFQCAGPQKLAAAVDRGQMLKRGQPGYELYFFPNVKAGKIVSFNTLESSTKKLEVSEGDHNNFSASVESFLDGGVDALLDVAALKDTPANLAVAPSGSARSSPLTVTVLVEKKQKLDKALNLAEKMQEAIQRLPQLPERLLQQSISLATALEKATLFGHEVDFMLKFKKDQKGEPLSAGLIVGTTNKLDVMILAVVEEVKVARALLGASSSAT